MENSWQCVAGNYGEGWDQTLFVCSGRFNNDTSRPVNYANVIRSDAAENKKINRIHSFFRLNSIGLVTVIPAGL